ncbi:nucleoporin Nup35 [Frieseomelitta varia]|uniref:nucleoporin Nup35 n=1 Tax=Frieseomelitta varia TaxID=561572 RepID=UPI001CB68A65|nr:nucleoporin Nup35 [Frieseomelitta varia]XP_043519807.1 nucleoporin Nup35 [Frieseomelitta varia]
MEPMALGSPVASPIQSPGSSATSAYLPNFLLGDSTTPAKINLMTPQDISKQFHSGLTSPLSHYGTPDYRSNRQKAVFGSANTPNTSQIVTESHTGGPPTRGLFDSLETSENASPYLSATNQSITCNQSKCLTTSMNNSIFRDGAMSSNANESQGLLQWVTVFGFPPNDITTVLAHISSRVRIVDKHPAPHSTSNWIHLKCASELEAQRAFACNGNIVSGSIMIGVIPCTDEGVILGSEKESRSKVNGSIKCLSTLGRVTQSPEYSTPRTPIRVQNARPLATGYNQNLSPQSIRSPENVPQKSTGLVSKAMEYMFGW